MRSRSSGGRKPGNTRKREPRNARKRERALAAQRTAAGHVPGRAGPAARRLSRLWAVRFGLGLAPRRWVTIEVAGRRSGRVTQFPLGMADWNGDWYLVPMLGDRSNWAQNVRAAGGHAIVRHGRARTCRLIEVPVGERGPIIRRYLDRVPGGRPHILVRRDAAPAAFDAIAPRYPVFRVVPAGTHEVHRTSLIKDGPS